MGWWHLRYYKKGLQPKNYGVETVEELAGLVNDTVVICPPKVPGRRAHCFSTQGVGMDVRKKSGGKTNMCILQYDRLREYLESLSLSLQRNQSILRIFKILKYISLSTDQNPDMLLPA